MYFIYSICIYFGPNYKKEKNNLYCTLIRVFSISIIRIRICSDKIIYVLAVGKLYTNKKIMRICKKPENKRLTKAILVFIFLYILKNTRNR
jgi:hypothetical protein